MLAAQARPCEQAQPSCTRLDAGARPQLTAQHLAFITNWQLVLGPKLTQLLELLGKQNVAANLALAQVWTYIPVLLEGRQVLKAEAASALLGDPALAPFHLACVTQGCAVSTLGPMGKVWEQGVVKVIQSPSELQLDSHPLKLLAVSGLQELVGEVVYIPVYEPGSRVSGGVVAVVELIFRSAGADAMAVANAISTLCRLMRTLQLSLSNPAVAAAPTAKRIGSGGTGTAPSSPQQAQPSLARTMSQGLVRTASRRSLAE